MTGQTSGRGTPQPLFQAGDVDGFFGLAIDNLIQGHLWLISFLFSLVIVFMVYSLFLFRRRDGEEGEGQYFHGNTTLEIVWTTVPMVLVIAFGYWVNIKLSDQIFPTNSQIPINFLFKYIKRMLKFKTLQKLCN